jgi:16S rRNA (uracil1498-N3)-methyltransferase
VHRFFLPPQSFHGDRIALPPEVARQIKSVLRLRSGERVVALDNSGDEYVVRLLSGGEGVVEERRTNRAEPATRLVLYGGTLKGSKLEMVLQKGTEIGVARFVPVITERSVAGEPGTGKQRRYEAIVREAAEQSGRGRIPDVAPAMTLREALEDAAGTMIAPWEEEGTRHLRSVSVPRGSTASVFIGPEGGFTPDEAQALQAAGAVLVTLGPRILRAETAAIAAASLVLGGAGEIG